MGETPCLPSSCAFARLAKSDDAASFRRASRAKSISRRMVYAPNWTPEG